MDNISNNNKTIKGFSLYYLSSGLLALALFLTNWIGGLIFLGAWLINYYFWTQLVDELGALPNLEQSAIIPQLLKKFNWGNLSLTVWASLLVILQIFMADLAWVIYPLALIPFLPPFRIIKTARKLRSLIEDFPFEVKELKALETLSQIETFILDEVTTGEVLVSDILLAEGIKEELFGKVIGTFLQALHTKDHIISGLDSHFKHTKTYPVKNIMVKSQDRNWSSMYLESIGTVFLGPAETILKETPDFVIQTLAEGKRVMALAVSQDEHHGKEVPEALFTIALLVLSDPIKPGVAELAHHLEKNKISLKILTKEDPIRIGNLCRYLGLNINGDEDITKQTVFGELNFQQKIEVCEWLSNSAETAYAGNLNPNLHCRISSEPTNRPHILLKQPDLTEIAYTVDNSLEVIRELLSE